MAMADTNPATAPETTRTLTIPPPPDGPTDVNRLHHCWTYPGRERMVSRRGRRSARQEQYLARRFAALEGRVRVRGARQRKLRPDVYVQQPAVHPIEQVLGSLLQFVACRDVVGEGGAR